MTVDEAARHLGLTVDAIRKRVQREQIPFVKDGAGRVRIILDESETLQDESPDNTGHITVEDYRGELVEELRDRVRYLEKLLDEEREARTEERRRQDTVIAQLSASNAEQARTIREIEAPQEVSEAAETIEEASEAEPRSAAGETQEGAEKPREPPSVRRPYVLGTILVVLAVLAVQGMNWLALLFHFRGLWGGLVSFNLLAIVYGIGSFALAFYVGYRSDHHVSWRFLSGFGVVLVVVLVSAAWVSERAYVALTRLVYAISDSAKLGAALRLHAHIERAVVVDPVRNLVGLGVIYVGIYVLFLSGAALGNALRRHRVPAPMLHPQSDRAASTEWTPRKQAILGFAGTVLGPVISLIGTIITVTAGS